MKLLAIDTATEACSAALMIDDQIEQYFEIAPREHAAKILVMIDRLMADAQLRPSQLDAMAYGRGPGSFIGVRIAAAVTQGIAFGADLPVVPVSSLAAIAQGSAHDNVLVAVDARMKEVYWGQYRRPVAKGNVDAQGEEQLLAPHAVTLDPPTDGAPWVGVGSGWATYREILVQRLPWVSPSDEDAYPAARAVAQLALAQFQLGHWVSASQALPMYLRDRVAQKPRQGS